MLAYPNVRVQANENTVWQRIISEDNYTHDIGMRPTEMFMRFNDNEYFKYDGTDLTITSDLNLTGDLTSSGVLNSNGFVMGDGTITMTKKPPMLSGIFAYEENGTTSSWYIYNGGTATTLASAVRLNISSTSGDIRVNAAEDLVISATNDLKLAGLPSDDTEDHVIAIDDTSGLLSKRSVTSLVSGSSSSIETRSIKVTVASADILTSNATPVELIPRPGAGKMIKVTSAVVQLNYGSAAYATNVTGYMRYTDGSGSIGGTSFTFSSAEDYIYVIGYTSASESGALANFADEAIVFATDTGNPATGDGTLDFFIAYQIITL